MLSVLGFRIIKSITGVFETLKVIFMLYFLVVFILLIDHNTGFQLCVFVNSCKRNAVCKEHEVLFLAANEVHKRGEENVLLMWSSCSDLQQFMA